jgi:RND family efflux transporter MFP subunit
MQAPQSLQPTPDQTLPLGYTLIHRDSDKGGQMVPQTATTQSKSLPARLAPFAIGSILLLAAAGTVAALVSTKPHPPKEEITAAPLVVRTLRTSPVLIARQWEGFGTASAPMAANIAALVAGPIIERPENINPGTWVQAGDLLAQIDPAEYQQRLERAQQQAAAIRAQLVSTQIQEESSQVSLALAEEAVVYTQRELVRLRDAASKGVATQTEVERLLRDLTSVQREAQTIRERLTTIPATRLQLQAELAARNADVELARLDLERTRIVAPFAGALQEVFVQVGERVNINQICARIVDLRRIEVDLRLPVSAVVTLTPGDTVQLRADNPSGQIWQGTIERIAPETDPDTRTATAFVTYEQQADSWQDNLLLPGQFVVATITTGTPRERIVVPRSAVISDRVYILNAQNQSQPRTITIAHHHEGSLPQLLSNNTQWVVVESGLSPGETLILSNLDDLKPGLPVVAQNSSQGDAP